MLRQAVISSFLVLSATSLTCYSGYYININGQVGTDNRTAVTCPQKVTNCIKEKISFSGENGHSVKAIRYDCDTPKTVRGLPVAECSLPFMNPVVQTDCKKPYDLWIGDICCCNYDKCNFDNASGSLLTLLPISFLAFFFL